MRNNNKKQGKGSKRYGSSRGFGSEGNRFSANSSRGYRGDSCNRGPREMHKVTCSECKKECEVPFKPTEGKPVYCKECFEKHKPKRF
jgi:CxxC-x17-CxxC domain-containing protein